MAKSGAKASGRALKVYRTPIGFYDAYVAAPSQKAALAAWGTAKNLFAREAAEMVTDPALTAAPLAHPGEVIRLARGSAAEHVSALGALPRTVPKSKRPVPPAEAAQARKLASKTPRPPKPSGAALELAQAALEAAHSRGRDRLRDIAERERVLAAERARAEAELASEIERREADLRRAKTDHIAALGEWRRA